jgi:acetyl esterase/lipase
MAIWTSHGLGRCSPGEADVVLLPKAFRGDGTVPGVIYCHGAGSDALSASDPVGHAGEWNLVRSLAERYPVVVADLGGPLTFANPTAMARIEDARRYLQGTWGARPGPVIMVGTSMGGLCSLNYAAAHRDRVAGVVGILPLSDLTELYTGHGGAFTPSVAAAWGVSATPPLSTLPVGADPTRKPAPLRGLRYQAWYAGSDTIVLPSTVTRLVSLMGAPATATNLGASHGHDEAAIGAVPVGQVLSFLASLPLA